MSSDKQKQVSILTKKNSDGTTELQFSIEGKDNVKVNISEDLQTINFNDITLGEMDYLHTQYYFQVLRSTVLAIKRVKEARQLETQNEGES